jgi:hypothetical protein
LSFNSSYLGLMGVYHVRDSLAFRLGNSNGKMARPTHYAIAARPLASSRRAAFGYFSLSSVSRSDMMTHACAFASRLLLLRILGGGLDFRLGHREHQALVVLCEARDRD